MRLKLSSFKNDLITDLMDFYALEFMFSKGMPVRWDEDERDYLQNYFREVKSELLQKMEIVLASAITDQTIGAIGWDYLSYEEDAEDTEFYVESPDELDSLYDSLFSLRAEIESKFPEYVDNLEFDVSKSNSETVSFVKNNYSLLEELYAYSSFSKYWDRIIELFRIVSGADSSNVSTAFVDMVIDVSHVSGKIFGGFDAVLDLKNNADNAVDFYKHVSPRLKKYVKNYDRLVNMYGIAMVKEADFVDTVGTTLIDFYALNMLFHKGLPPNWDEDIRGELEMFYDETQEELKGYLLRIMAKAVVHQAYGLSDSVINHLRYWYSNENEDGEVVYDNAQSEDLAYDVVNFRTHVKRSVKFPTNFWIFFNQNNREQLNTADENVISILEQYKETIKEIFKFHNQGDAPEDEQVGGIWVKILNAYEQLKSTTDLRPAFLDYIIDLNHKNGKVFPALDYVLDIKNSATSIEDFLPYVSKKLQKQLQNYEHLTDMYGVASINPAVATVKVPMWIADLYATWDIVNSGGYPPRWSEDDISAIWERFEEVKGNLFEFLEYYLPFTIYHFLSGDMAPVTETFVNMYKEKQNFDIHQKINSFEEYKQIVDKNMDLVYHIIRHLGFEPWDEIYSAYEKVKSGNRSVELLDTILHLEHVRGSIFTRIQSSSIKEQIRKVLDVRKNLSDLSDLIPYVSPMMRKYVQSYVQQKNLHGLARKAIGISMREDSGYEDIQSVNKPLSVNDIDKLVQELGLEPDKISAYIDDNYTEGVKFQLPIIEFDTKDEKVMRKYFQIPDEADTKEYLKEVAKKIDAYLHDVGEIDPDVEFRFGLLDGMYALIVVSRDG